jgi:hypothetical protein
MKQVLTTIAVLFLVATGIFFVDSVNGADPYDYTTEDRSVALAVWEKYPEQDDMCDILWAYDKDQLKAELSKAYNNGKPDGSIWVNAGIRPTVPQVMALVDIQYDYCKDK